MTGNSFTNAETQTEEQPIVLGSRSEEIVQCSKCGKELKVEERHAFEGEDGEDVYFCDECLAAVNNELDKMTKNLNIPLALAFSLATAVVCAVLYGGFMALTNIDLAIISIGVGYLVALAACKGAGDKRGLKLQIMSVIFTLGAILLANDIFYLASIPEYQNLIGAISILIVGPIGYIQNAGPIGLIIAAVGLYPAYTIPKAAKL